MSGSALDRITSFVARRTHVAGRRARRTTLDNVHGLRGDAEFAVDAVERGLVRPIFRGEKSSGRSGVRVDRSNPSRIRQHPPHRHPQRTATHAARPLQPRAGAAHPHAVPAPIGLPDVVDDAPTHAKRVSVRPAQPTAHAPLAAPAATPPSPADAARQADRSVRAAGPTPSVPGVAP
jgi:hypothetical protein